MIVFWVMSSAIIAARLAGVLGVASLNDWPAATRTGLAVMFVFTGVAHFSRTRADLIRMVPPALPRPALIVTLTGVAELAGAAGLLVPRVAPIAAAALAMLLVAMFPANVYAARTAHTIGGRPHTPMAVRGLLQVLWIALLVWVAVTSR